MRLRSFATVVVLAVASLVGATQAPNPAAAVDPVVVASSVTAGDQFSCGITAAGGATCWGRNSNGQLGNGGTAATGAPGPVTGLTSGVTAISSGYSHTCAVVSGDVWCWGANNVYELGTTVPTGSYTTVPLRISRTMTRVPAGAVVTEVSAGYNHTCAIAAGVAYCWGSNGNGQLGGGYAGGGGPLGGEVVAPASVGGSPLASISAGTFFTCAVATNTGTAWCWGNNVTRQLGGPTSAVQGAPQPVLGMGSAADSPSTGVTAVSAGNDHACAIRSGAAWCWGFNGYGQLGRGTVSSTYEAPALVTGTNVNHQRIDAGYAGTCSLQSGQVRCWGGGLGNGTSSWSGTPVVPTGLTEHTSAVSVGRGHSCAVVAGVVSCWGGFAGLTPASTVPVANPGTTFADTTVPVNNAPTADAKDVWARRVGPPDNPRTITLTGSDPDGTPLAFRLVTAPTRGTMTCSGATCTYRATVSGGSDSFTYVVDDGAVESAPATVAITIGNRAPTADDLTLTVSPGETVPVVFPAVDPDGDAVFISPGSPTKGTLTASGPTPTQVTYTYAASPTASGTDSFTYFAHDGNEWSPTATVAIRILGVPTAPTGVTAVAGSQQATVSWTAPSFDGWSPITGYVVTPYDGEVPVPAQTFDASTTTRTLTGLPDVPLRFTVKAVNAEGTGPESAKSAVPAPTIEGSRSPAANANGWNNEPVTASFTCVGAGLTSCSAPTVLSADGAGQSVTGTAVGAGGTSTATVSGVSIDRVAPTLAGVATTDPNEEGWYREPVIMDWTCADALSGIVPGSCPASAPTVGEGTAVSVAASVTDRAGNTTTASSQTVKVDTTKPSTGVSSPPTWSSSDVALTLSPTDALSGVASTSYRVDGGPVESGTAPLVSGQGVHSVQFWSTDVAGNVEVPQSVIVRIDTTAPTIFGQRTPEPNAAGWNNTPVTVTFLCGDGPSGVASCSPPQSFFDEVDTSSTGTVTDRAGNTVTEQVPVRIDMTAPTITAQVPPANGSGWFNAPVQVGFSCADTGGSGVASCPDPLVISGEGADQPVTGTVADAAGNTAEVAGQTVSLDLTAPTITGAVIEPANPAGGYTTSAHVRWTCADTLSGVVACPADTAVTGEGIHTVSASVTDRAGTTTTAQVTLRIDRDASIVPGTVHGTVTDELTGALVAGATVRLTNPATGANAYVTRTGTDGTYTFPLVADGSYRVAVANNNVHLPRWFPDASTATGGQVVAVTHGASEVADVALRPGHVLRGTVTGPDGGPIGGATLRFTTGTGIVTDAAGAYEIRGLLTGTYTFTTVAYGFVSAASTVVVDGDVTLDRSLAAAAPSSGLKGTIRAAVGGGPLAGATVRIWPKGAVNVGITTTTGADGRFTFPSLASGTFEVDVVRGDYRARWWVDAASRAAATPLAVGPACTSSPDTSWGDPCSATVAIAMLKP